MSYGRTKNRPLRNGFRDPPRGAAPAATPEPATLPAVIAEPRPPRARQGGWTAAKQKVFFQRLAATGSVERAAEYVGMSESSAYRLRSHPGASEFRAGWATALAACVTTARDLAFERAFNGSVETLAHNGVIKGNRTVFNDRLLMFLLRNYDTCVNDFGAPCIEERFARQLELLVDAPDLPPEFADITIAPTPI